MTGPIAREIETLLGEAFAPMRLEVINDSASHSGHMGDDGSGESHFTIQIESASFAGVPRLQRLGRYTGPAGSCTCHQGARAGRIRKQR